MKYEVYMLPFSIVVVVYFWTSSFVVWTSKIHIVLVPRDKWIEKKVSCPVLTWIYWQVTYTMIKLQCVHLNPSVRNSTKNTALLNHLQKVISLTWTCRGKHRNTILLSWLMILHSLYKLPLTEKEKRNSYFLVGIVCFQIFKDWV